MKDKWKCKNPIICNFQSHPDIEKHCIISQKQVKNKFLKNQNFKNIKVQKGMMKIQDQQRGRGKGIA